MPILITLLAWVHLLQCNAIFFGFFPSCFVFDGIIVSALRWYRCWLYISGINWHGSLYLKMFSGYWLGFAGEYEAQVIFYVQGYRSAGWREVFVICMCWQFSDISQTVWCCKEMFKTLDDVLELLKLLFTVWYNFGSVLGQTVAIAMLCIWTERMVRVMPSFKPTVRVVFNWVGSLIWD